MDVIDAQLHDPAPWLDWSGSTTETSHRMLTELILAYLDTLGVAGAILFPRGKEWGMAAAKAQPKRLAYVLRVDPEVPDLERYVDEANEGDGLVALRAVITRPDDASEGDRLEAGTWDPVFAACESYEVPLFMVVTDRLPLVATVAQRHPDLKLIIDHLGLRQPPHYPRRPPPLQALPDLLALAEFPNVAVKVCGLPALSDEAFPYQDVVPHLRSVIDAFGPSRLMWASDISRFYGRIGLDVHGQPEARQPYPGKHTYDESLNFIKLCDSLTAEEKEWILGGTARAVLKWPPRTG